MASRAVPWRCRVEQNVRTGVVVRGAMCMAAGEGSSQD